MIHICHCVHIALDTLLYYLLPAGGKYLGYSRLHCEKVSYTVATERLVGVPEVIYFRMDEWHSWFHDLNTSNRFIGPNSAGLKSMFYATQMLHCWESYSRLHQAAWSQFTEGDVVFCKHKLMVHLLAWFFFGSEDSIFGGGFWAGEFIFI